MKSKGQIIFEQYCKFCEDCGYVNEYDLMENFNQYAENLIQDIGYGEFAESIQTFCTSDNIFYTSYEYGDIRSMTFGEFLLDVDTNKEFVEYLKNQIEEIENSINNIKEYLSETYKVID